LEETCQRCHETFREGDRYCPICGLPQLIYVAADMPQVAGVEISASAAGRSVGDRADAFGSDGGIVWRPALNAALTLGVPAGILSFGILPLGLLGMIAASAWAVGLYAKRARVARLTTGMGAQIGLVTGLFASWLATSLYGVGLWFSRFVLHEGGEWDSLWVGQVERSNQQMLAQMGTANAQSAQVAQSLRTMMLSAEGRAGLPLSGLLVVAAILVVLAVAGGALGAKMAAAPRRSGA
jgi:RNA polymerase subunit RPABC4/transcription elongation factor Spt4